MSEKKHLASGTRVKHKLSGWTGYILIGREVNLSLGDFVPIYSTRFYNPATNEFIELDVIEEEIDEQS